MSLPLQLGERRFEMAQQRFFAELSGDHNPMHLDPVAARRTQAGAPVAHGMHTALWAIDAFYAARACPAPNRLTARFDRFIYLDEAVVAELRLESAERVEMDLSVEGGRVATIRLEFGEGKPSAPHPCESVDSPATCPADLSMEDLAAAAGCFAYARPAAAAAAAFPHASETIGAGRINGLIALSTLVGMHCPGLHSIFSRFEVDLHDGPADEHAELAFRVRRTQPLLRMATIDVVGAGISGAVNAFLRHPPVRQPKIAQLVGAIEPGAFAGARVLVVGGSRGLGELIVKLSALGGADVVATYASGCADAEAVVEEVRDYGARCEAFSLDAGAAIASQLTGAGAFTHVYYLASPPIFRKRSSSFSPDVLAEFLQIYATAFFELCTILARQGDPVRIFYPSSVAVEDPPKGAIEYAMAKAAAELLCVEVVRRFPALDIVLERLPRLLTDQTATVLPVESPNAVEILLPIIGRMHAP